MLVESLSWSSGVNILLKSEMSFVAHIPQILEFFFRQSSQVVNTPVNINLSIYFCVKETCRLCVTVNEVHPENIVFEQMTP
jgi:hypothetical protein